MMFVHCKNCVAWKEIDGSEKGACYGGLPKAFPVMGQGLGGPQLAVVTVRPETLPGDGCLYGEAKQLDLLQG